MSFQVVVLALAMGLVSLASALIGIVAGMLVWVGGAEIADALMRGGAAFSGALTLGLVVIGLFIAANGHTG
jgi:hypothetical protein